VWNCDIKSQYIETDGRRFEDMYADIVSAVNIGIMED
jgi:shikimate kinase